MNYGDLIRDAFRITLHNRYLWFFGFFVGGTGFNFVGNVPSTGGNFNPDRFQRSGAGLSGLPAQVGQGVLGNAALVLGIVIVVLIVVLLFIFMAIVSQGALADSVAGSVRPSGRGWLTSGVCSATTSCSSWSRSDSSW
jgi:hypothetical protein